MIFIEDGSFSYDNRVIREADALLADGWDITVISPKYPDDPFYRRVGPKLRAYFYPKPNAQSAIGHIAEHAISLVLGSLLTLWVALRHGFTVFHACNPLDILWLIAAPYRLFGKRFIFDQHDLCPELYLSREDGDENSRFFAALKFLERGSYRSADAVIATNESYKRTTIERGGKKPEEVFVVRNGPDTKKFRRVSPRTGLKQEGDVLVGYLGNMNAQDGVDVLLDAAARIVQKGGRRDLKFVFIGGGSCQEILAEQVVTLGMEGNATFTGRVPDDDMLAILSACDLCVQPDPPNPLNDKSTMNKVLEYMALAIPVVAFDLVETRVSCGEAALYAEGSDSAELSRKILELADDPVRREEMGLIGRNKIRDSLAWEYSVPHLIEAYHYAIGRSRRD